ncbi:MAG: caspase family protein [Bacteroidota bacterium]
MVKTYHQIWQHKIREKAKDDFHLLSYLEDFRSESHAYLAICSSFLPICTFDLLAKLYQNFPLPSGHSKSMIPIHVLVGDFLNSPLCKHIGLGMFELRTHPIKILYAILETLAYPTVQELGNFLHYYLQEENSRIPSNSCREIFRWTQTIINDPESAAKELLEARELENDHKIAYFLQFGDQVYGQLTPDTSSSFNPLSVAIQFVQATESATKGELDRATSLVSSIISKIEFKALPHTQHIKISNELWGRMKMEKEKLSQKPIEIEYSDGLRKRALIVGIDHYENLYDLHGCIQDAHKMKEALDRHEDSSPNFYCKTLTSEYSTVTKSQLKKEIIKLFNQKSADVLLFYFSGHGVKTKMGTYLSTSDARRYNEGVSLTNLFYLIQSSTAKEIIIILDCCHSGAAGGFINENSALLQSNVSILRSSYQDELSKASDNVSFTELVCDAFTGGAADLLGEVNIVDVYAYTDKILRNDDQRPTLRSYATNLNSLRKNKPKVSKSVLRRLPNYFEHPRLELPLSPEFEPEMEPHDQVKEAIFRDLQHYRRFNLVEPVGADHMYHAALYSKSCRLTPSGRYYWERANKGLI